MFNRPNSLTIIIAGAAAIAAITTIAAMNAHGSDRGGTLSEQLFSHSTQCTACHNGISDAQGKDISIGLARRAAMMSHSAEDPYWHAGVRREITEHPESAEAIEDICSSCHMPMARYGLHQTGAMGEVFSNLEDGNTRDDSALAALAGDGVSCTVCHQIKADNLGKKESFGAGFLVDSRKSVGDRTEFGPFEVGNGNAHIMASATGYKPAAGSHIQSSELCGSCHTLYTHALDKSGKRVAELPEQMPYIEWLSSDYAQSQSCQDCHMTPIEGEAAASSVLGLPRPDLRKHDFLGGNFFMLRLLGKNASALGLHALPSELTAAAAGTENLLASASSRVMVDETGISIENQMLSIPVVVENLTGHKLPTAYPSRRSWIHFVAADDKGRIFFESGALKDNGAVSGNDNDEDASRFEPHYEIISRPTEVQVFEAIMGDPAGKVTTGLLNGAMYLKDNRIPPFGFDKESVPSDVAVHGNAVQDANFGDGKDRVVYRFPVGETAGPIRISVDLYYQPIGYRWAENLATVDAFEPKRFLSMYRNANRRKTAVHLASVEWMGALPTAAVAEEPASPAPVAEPAQNAP